MELLEIYIKKVMILKIILKNNDFKNYLKKIKRIKFFLVSQSLRILKVILKNIRQIYTFYTKYLAFV